MNYAGLGTVMGTVGAHPKITMGSESVSVGATAGARRPGNFSHPLLPRWIKHPLIRFPLLRDLRQELSLGDHPLFYEQLGQRIGLHGIDESNLLLQVVAFCTPSFRGNMLFR